MYLDKVGFDDQLGLGSMLNPDLRLLKLLS